MATEIEFDVPLELIGFPNVKFEEDMDCSLADDDHEKNFLLNDVYSWEIIKIWAYYESTFFPGTYVQCESLCESFLNFCKIFFANSSTPATIPFDDSEID